MFELCYHLVVAQSEKKVIRYASVRCVNLNFEKYQPASADVV